MRILVTNDDGVESPGLHALARRFRKDGHDIIVVAPTSDRSGASASIGTLHRAHTLPVNRHDAEDLGDHVYALDLPPAAVVYAACLGGFGDPPDVVASGINPGPNTGHLVLHSGTVGAALTAAGLGVPGLAVSLQIAAEGEEYQWETAAEVASTALEWVREAERPIVLNCNVPNRPLGQLEGIREATLAPYGSVWAASARHGEDGVVVQFSGNDTPAPAGTDLALLLEGFVAVTPLDGIEHASVGGAAEAIRAALAEGGFRPEP